jgi:hypothetical protein
MLPSISGPVVAGCTRFHPRQMTTRQATGHSHGIDAATHDPQPGLWITSSRFTHTHHAE